MKPNPFNASLFLLFSLILNNDSVLALNISDPGRFECRQGDCKNGKGIVWDALLSVTMEGEWLNGNTIPNAKYTVVCPLLPNKKFKQVYGQDGLLKSGDLPRTLGVIGNAIPSFRGNYIPVKHTFSNNTVAVINNGVYDTGVGIEYRGRFEYIPAKIKGGMLSGYYIFYGAKIDTVDHEKESGLFVSDNTYGGSPVHFTKAEPSYLAELQQRYQRDMDLAKNGFDQQKAEQGWGVALSVIGKIGISLATGGLVGNGDNNSLIGDIALKVATNMINQDSSNMNVKEIALQAIGTAVTGDKKLGKILGKAVNDGIEEAKRNK